MLKKDSKSSKILILFVLILALFVQIIPIMPVVAVESAIPDSIIWDTTEVSWWSGFYFLNNKEDGKNLKFSIDSANDRIMTTVSGEGTPWLFTNTGTEGKFYIGASSTDNSLFTKDGSAIYAGEFYYQYNRITNNEGLTRAVFSLYKLTEGKYVLADELLAGNSYIIVAEINGKGYALSNTQNTDNSTYLLYDYDGSSYNIKGVKGIEVAISDNTVTGIVLSEEDANATPTPEPTATPVPTALPVPDDTFTLYANNDYYNNIYGRVSAVNPEGEKLSGGTVSLYTYDAEADTAAKIEPEVKVGTVAVNTASNHNVTYSFDKESLYGKEVKITVNHVISHWGPEYKAEVTYYDENDELQTSEAVVYSPRSESNTINYNNVLLDKEIGTFKNVVEVKTTAYGGGNGLFYAVTFEFVDSEPEVTAVPGISAEEVTFNNLTTTAEVAEKAFTAFAKLTNITADAADSFGIIFASGDEAITEDMAKDGKIYEAKGALSDGSFSVKLINGGPVDYLNDNHIGIIPYVKVDGVIYYGAFQTIK